MSFDKICRQYRNQIYSYRDQWFFFRNSDSNGFESKIKTIAEKLAGTPVRNFWISIDSAEPEVHEKMRGFPGVLKGIEKGLKIFHQFGIYPSANLGINRNMAVNIIGMKVSKLKNRDSARKIYDNYREAFQRFYHFIINMGFTMVNMCYPMSVDCNNKKSSLYPVYAATTAENIVKFSPSEKRLLFKALLQTIPEFRSKIRIFTPLCSLYILARQGVSGPVPYSCLGGIDFFFIDSRDGNTYPCGYRGNENLGKYWQTDVDAVCGDQKCVKCDWECFRDPSELFGPVLQGISRPTDLIKKIKTHPEYFGLWINDLRYHRACDFFNGRRQPDYNRLKGF